MAATDATADILHLHEWLTTLTDGAGKSGDGAGATEILALTEDAEDRLARLGVGRGPTWTSTFRRRSCAPRGRAARCSSPPTRFAPRQRWTR
jgi:hypothetical protein